MPVPAGVNRWLSLTYPKPKVDGDWLAGCYDYIYKDNPNRSLDEVIKCVDEHLLSSNLSDSMEPNTGFPTNVTDLKDTRLQGSILVEVVAMMEVGHSAFNLMNVRQTRLEQADLAGLENEDEEDPEDEGPIPSYPRSMLKLQISDGHTVIPAMEFSRLPQLILGETPLGCKMLLKDVLIRKGIAFLDPKSVTFKGGINDERAATQDRDFLAALKFRMSLPIDDPNDVQEEDQRNGAPPTNNGTRRAPPPQHPPIRRSPFREITEPPEPSSTLKDHADDDNATLRRRVPTIHHSLNPPSLGDAAIEERRSRYFSSQSTSKTLTTQDGIFSPLRSSTTAIEILSSPAEERVASSSALPQPNTESQSSQHFTGSDVEDDDMQDLEDLAFWAHLAKAESAAVGENHISETVVPASEPRSSLRYVPDTSQRSATVSSSAVVIEDTEDKENIPVPARRVRRRPATQPPVEDIIEISD